MLNERKRYSTFASEQTFFVYNKRIVIFDNVLIYLIVFSVAGKRARSY